MHKDFDLKMTKEICTNAEIVQEVFEILKTAYPWESETKLMMTINAAIQLMIAKAIEKECI